MTLREWLWKDAVSVKSSRFEDAVRLESEADRRLQRHGGCEQSSYIGS